MADTGFSGDPFHEGTNKPMAGLKGDMAQPHTQMPMTSEAQNNPRSAAIDNITNRWDAFEAPHQAPTGNNDKNAAH